MNRIQFYIDYLKNLTRVDHFNRDLITNMINLVKSDDYKTNHAMVDFVL